MFSALWVGKEIPMLQRMCLNSFAKHGHNISLFVYQEYDLPKGIIQKDANQIILEKDIFTKDTHFGISYSQFSDVFRYQLLKKCPGTIWVDADTLCNSESVSFLQESEYAFLKEEYQGLLNFVGGILKLPNDSDFLNFLISESSRIVLDNMTWSEIGPSLITRYVKENQIQDMAIEESKIFFPKERSQIVFDERMTDEIMKAFDENDFALTVLWNSLLTNQGFVLNESNIHQYKNTFVGEMFNKYYV